MEKLKPSWNRLKKECELMNQGNNTNNLFEELCFKKEPKIGQQLNDKMVSREKNSIMVVCSWGISDRAAKQGYIW